jgi:hypothetical protein
MKVQTGNKSKHSWAHGIANQILWFIYIFWSGSYGLLPMTVGLVVIYIRNHIKWNRESPDAKDRDLIKGM